MSDPQKNTSSEGNKTKSSVKFPWKIYSKPIAIQIIFILLILISSGLILKRFVQNRILDQTENQLQDTAILLSHDIDDFIKQDNSAGWCALKAKGTSLRVTLIDRSGVVICDSHHYYGTMESHAHRPEVIDALRQGSGSAIRKSDTLNENLIYVAILSPEKEKIVRVSISLKNLEQSLSGIDLVFWLVAITITVTLSIFAMWSGKRLIQPLSQILEKARNVLEYSPKGHVNDGSYLTKRIEGEWSELETSLDSIHRNLLEKIDSLSSERQEQSALMSAISDAILAVDTNELPLFFNSRFAVLFGSSMLKEPKHLSEIFREPEILNVFRLALSSGQSSDSKAIQLRMDQEKKFFSVSVSPLKNESGQTYGAVGVFHDVTDLKLAEQIRIDFVANVSHELRTPLTSIKGYADTLKNDFENFSNTGHEAVPTQWKDFIATIVRNTERLMNLISDLLDLSAIESSDRIQKREIDTAEFSERAIQKIAGLIESKSHIVRVAANAKTVFADPIRLEQVVVNLLDNACKYTPERGQITIKWEEEKNDFGHNTILKVIDTGPGISPEHHSRLFERFYRVDKGRSREMGGTGLGLAIVKHIMQRHGGTVGVISELGSGTTFICTFPKNESV